MRGCCDGQIFYTGKGILFAKEVTPYIALPIALRIPVQQFAVPALGLPLHTLDLREMCAMAGKSPAIMQSPNDGDIRFLQKAEQHLVIHIEAVQRVQVDQIRLKRSDFSDHPSCRGPGIQTGVVCQSRYRVVKVIPKLPRHPHRVRIVGTRSRAV